MLFKNKYLDIMIFISKNPPEKTKTLLFKSKQFLTEVIIIQILLRLHFAVNFLQLFQRINREILNSTPLCFINKSYHDGSIRAGGIQKDFIVT